MAAAASANPRGACTPTFPQCLNVNRARRNAEAQTNRANANGLGVGAHFLYAGDLNLYDGTVEGFAHTSKPIFSVQYHPEASPGPHDADYLFRQFIESMEKR